MKKIIICILTFLFVLPSFANGVGYINYGKILENYQYSKQILRELDTKETEIIKYLQKKEEEYNKLESAVQKNKLEETVKTEMRTKEKAFEDFKNKKEEDVYNKIHAASEKIRLEKRLDAIIDRDCVFSGGIDITDEIIKLLNGQ